MDESGAVRLGVDVGGTFTDVVLVADGTVTTTKVPTTDDQSEGVLAGIEAACERAAVDPESVEQFRHAMTVATNAMLEGTGAQTALVTTEGFGDVLAIGRQDRPALYDQSVQKPAPLVPAERRYELPERATPDGIEAAVSEDAIDHVASRIDEATESVAVSLLHAYAHPENERKVADVLGDRLDATVVASHETLPEFREYERTATTVADAYVTPVIARYLDRLDDRATDRGVPSPAVMQSSGGIAATDTLHDHAVTTVLSGPAAGVVGATPFEADENRGAITFDMGGTSSDVGLVVDGDIERTTEATVAGHPVHVPMVDIETVGAGGGSIAWVDAGGALRVGPQSAGADPGPACYGQGGTEPTVTDAAVVLGYLGPETELGGDLTLDSEAARRAVSRVAEEAGLDGPVEAAQGIYRVSNATMTRAIRRVTVERGHDPRAFGLVAFGGAGPMHACALADELDIGAVSVPLASGVLSAFGLLAADERHDVSRTVHESADAVEVAAIEESFDGLEAQALDAAATPDAATVSRRADLRYAGQSYELTVEVPAPFDVETAIERFHAAHERTRGYRLPEESVELVTLRVTARVPGDEPDIAYEGDTDQPWEYRDAFFGDSFVETPVYERSGLAVGTEFDGPAIVESPESTAVVPPGWHGSVDERGTLQLEGRR